MLNHSYDVHLSHLQQRSWPLNDLSTGSRAEQRRLALEDAMRAIAEDSLLEDAEITGLLIDDFSSPLYFHRETWDKFEWHALFSDLSTETVMTTIDERH